MAQKKPTRKSAGAKTSSKRKVKPKTKSSVAAKKKKPSKPKATSGKKKTVSAKSKPAKKPSSKASSVKKGKKRKISKPSKPKKPAPKAQSKSSSKRVVHTSASSSKKPTASKGLSAQDRYNAGGLLTCAIDRDRDPGSRKLRKALQALQLSRLEQENLVRLTQGFTIPKLFADEFSDDSIRRMVVKEVEKFAKGESNYQRDWQEDINRFSTWLGVRID